MSLEHTLIFTFEKKKILIKKIMTIFSILEKIFLKIENCILGHTLTGLLIKKNKNINYKKYKKKLLRERIG